MMCEKKQFLSPTPNQALEDSEAKPTPACHLLHHHRTLRPQVPGGACRSHKRSLSFGFEALCRVRVQEKGVLTPS